VVDDPSAEQQFIKRLRARDERAFNELVEVYGTRIYCLMFRILGRSDEAEDMTQEIFVHVFKKIAMFQGTSGLGTWLYRVAVNQCRNRFRTVMRRKEELRWAAPVDHRATLAQARGTLHGEQQRPDQVAEGYQLEKIIRHCILELDPDHREAVVLRDVENLSLEEITEITGLSLGAVKSRLRRARVLLMRCVERARGERIP
jgi:RNA polymerase sigma-70 factor (ECF subfamily)